MNFIEMIDFLQKLRHVNCIIGGLWVEWRSEDAGKLHDYTGISKTSLSGRDINCFNLPFCWQLGQRAG